MEMLEYEGNGQRRIIYISEDRLEEISLDDEAPRREPHSLTLDLKVDDTKA